MKRAQVHTLRHSYAIRLLEAGVNLRIIQDALRHRGARTTQTYTHLACEMRAALTERRRRLQRHASQLAMFSPEFVRRFYDSLR